MSVHIEALQSVGGSTTKVQKFCYGLRIATVAIGSFILVYFMLNPRPFIHLFATASVGFLLLVCLFAANLAVGVVADLGHSFTRPVTIRVMQMGNNQYAAKVDGLTYLDVRPTFNEALGALVQYHPDMLGVTWAMDIQKDKEEQETLAL